MTSSNSEVSFLVDCMVVEALASTESGLTKTAQAGGLISALIDKVKTYIGSKIDPNDKMGSLIDALAPGALWLALRMMGLGWLGALLGLGGSVFHFSISDILHSIYSKVKSALSGGQPLSSSQVDDMVASSVKENNKEPTEQEAQQAQSKLETKTSDLMRDVRLVKLALISYQSQGLTKEAGFFDIFKSKKSSLASILTKVLGWVFKIAIASAGFMVAGDVVNKALGRPNSLDGSYQKGKETPAQAPAIPASTSTQKVFPVNPGYHDDAKNVTTSWVEPGSNDDAGVENMLIGFAKDVYQGLNGKEGLIRNSPAFQVVKKRIVFNNRLNDGTNTIVIPAYLKSKKQIVDLFIDDVAEKAGPTSA